MNEDLLAAELGTVTSLVPRDQLDGCHTTTVEGWRLAVEAYQTGLCWADVATNGPVFIPRA